MNVLVLVNGEHRELPAGSTVATVVEMLSDTPQGRGVAVALAGEVVPRGAWDQTTLSDGYSTSDYVSIQSVKDDDSGLPPPIRTTASSRTARLRLP